MKKVDCISEWSLVQPEAVDVQSVAVSIIIMRIRSN